ncbi:MAG: hypothetical protein AABX47_09340 [Nanoarchaeota archaeon]
MIGTLGGFAAFFSYAYGLLVSLVSVLGPPETISRLVFFTVFGAVTRVSLAVYLKYKKDGFFKPAWKRIFIEIIFAAFFGSIGAWLMAELGTVPSVVKVTYTVLLFIGGLIGPNMILKGIEAFGAEKLFEDVAVSAPSGLTERQRKGLTYARENNQVTNKEYRKVNSVSDTTAESDLQDLTEKGLLKRFGSTKGTRYEAV